VQLRLLKGLIRVAEQASLPTHWSFVRHQKQMIEHSLKQQNLIDLDKKKLLTVCRLSMNTLKKRLTPNIKTNKSNGAFRLTLLL
jgi:hypothetical protein